jgi:T5SS/PEP-CTERM-associated repeat protein
VGREGDGTLSVTGGVVRSVNASLGAEPSGEGIAFVSGQSANWTIDNVFTIGAAGDANVIVTGGHVISRDAIVGSVPASDGVVNVSDAGEWTTTGRLSIGGQTIGGTSGGSGLFRNSGGDVTVEGEVVISANGWFDFQGGTMAASTVTVEPGGHFMWTGGLFDVDEFNGNLNNQGGSLTSQHTQINGDYTQGGLGRLSISVLGDSASGMYDSVDVTGTANLGGTFEIPASNLYQPSAVDSYTVLRAADIIGSFNNAASGQRIANGNVSFIVYYGAGSPFNPDHVVLAEFLPVVLPGDFNEDGAVDAADYVVWRKNPGGMFTADDYDLWRANFGRLALGTVGSLIANEVTAPVPESETLWLLTIGLVWARLGRSRVAELANGATGKSVFVTIRGAVTTVKNRC